MNQDKRVYAKTVKILSRYTELKKNNIQPSTRLRYDLGLSSFDYFTIICEFEEKFKITIDNWETLGQADTVGDLVEVLSDSIEHHKSQS